MISCVTEQDPLPEIGKTGHSETDPFRVLRLVVATLDIAVGPGDVRGVQDFIEPVAIGFDATRKFRKIHDLDIPEPVNEHGFPFWEEPEWVTRRNSFVLDGNCEKYLIRSLSKRFGRMSSTLCSFASTTMLLYF